MIGDPDYYKICKAMFVCGTAMATDAGMAGLLESNFQKARELLKEAGYDGTPVVLMHSTDLSGADQPRAGREVADGEGGLQGRHAVDGLADAGRAPRQEGPAERGRLERVPDLLGVRRHPQSRDGGLHQCGLRQGDVRLAVRRRRSRSCATQFARETDPAKQKEIAAAVQKRNTEFTTHLFLGQWYSPAAARKNIDGIPDRARAGVLERREEEPVVSWHAVAPAPEGAGDQAGTIAPPRRKEEPWLPSLKSSSLLRGRARRCAGSAGAKTLRVAMHSDLKIVDPIWTTALITVNHGYMIYDTLFALDDKLDRQAADGRQARDRAPTS